MLDLKSTVGEARLLATSRSSGHVISGVSALYSVFPDA